MKRGITVRIRYHLNRNRSIEYIVKKVGLSENLVRLLISFLKANK